MDITDLNRISRLLENATAADLEEVRALVGIRQNQLAREYWDAYYADLQAEGKLEA